MNHYYYSSYVFLFFFLSELAELLQSHSGRYTTGFTAQVVLSMTS